MGIDPKRLGAATIKMRLLLEKSYQVDKAVFSVSAWLWPYAETIRKCARSFSSTIRLLEQYPQYTFACSQVST